MKKLKKVFVIYFLIIVIGIVTATVYHNSKIEGFYEGEIIIGLNNIKEIPIEREKIFGVLADIENYPNVLPDNIISVNIINREENGVLVIFAEETITEAGVITTLVVKHTIIPYQKHIIEIMEGDAEGTIITMEFKQIAEGTELVTGVEIRLKGILSPFGTLLTPNLESALNTSLDSFVDYAKTHG